MRYEPFTLRSSETITLSEEPPKNSKIRYIAVQARSVKFPKGKIQKKTPAGKPVENLAIIAAEKVPDGWIWVQLGPETKEIIGDYMIDECFIKPDKWYYLEIR